MVKYPFIDNPENFCAPQNISVLKKNIEIAIIKYAS